MGANDLRRTIQFAMENEVDARNFYRDAAKKLDNPSLKEIFAQLAEEEQNHFDLLQGLQKKGAFDGFLEEVKDFGVSETVEEPALSTDMEPADAFALAMKKEEEAMRLYTRLADACKDASEKKCFLELAAMEREHKQKMENAFVNIGYPEKW